MRNNILREEKRYFEYFAAKIGLSPDDFFLLLKSQYKTVYNISNEFYKGKTPHLHKVEEITSIESYFNLRRKSFSDFKSTCVQTIIDFQKNFSNFDFIDLTNVTTRDLSILKKNLEEIPIILLFDEEFEFSLSEEETYVIRNHSMFDMLTTNLIFPIFFNSCTNLDTEKSTRKDYSMEEISELIKNSMDAYSKGELIKVNSIPDLKNHELTNHLTDENQFFGRDCYYGMQYFACFHEYAHYLARHLDRKITSFEAEMEADILAINLLFDNTNKYFSEHLSNSNQIVELLLSSRLLAPPLYFFLKIIENIGDNSIEPNYFFRFFYSREIIEILSHLHGYSSVSKLMGILHNLMLETIKTLGVNEDDIKQFLATSFEKKDKLGVKLIAVSNKGILKDIDLKPFMDIFNQRIKF